MSAIPEIMKTVTQDEVNKAAHSRSYAILDDMRARIQIELIAINEEIGQLEDKGEKPTRQILYNRKVIIANLDRLERRITDLAERAEQRSMRYHEKQERYELALARAGEVKKAQGIIAQLAEAKNNTTIEDLRNIEPLMATWALRIKAGETLEDIQRTAKIKEDNQNQILSIEEWDKKLAEEQPELKVLLDGIDKVDSTIKGTVAEAFEDGEL